MVAIGSFLGIEGYLTEIILLIFKTDLIALLLTSDIIQGLPVW